jgi:hypothetical protein
LFGELRDCGVIEHDAFRSPNAFPNRSQNGSFRPFRRRVRVATGFVGTVDGEEDLGK